nr:hypothetical protein [Tanacetum cinerariifolium]
MVGEASSFLLTPQALKNLVYLFRSIGIPQNREALSVEGAALYTRLGTGLLGVVNKRILPVKYPPFRSARVLGAARKISFSLKVKVNSSTCCCRSLGIPQNKEALSAEGAALYTKLGTGLLGVVNKRSFYGTPLPTDIYPPDASYVDFFRESFYHPLYKKLTFIESKYIMRDLLKSFENFNLFNQIEVPLTRVFEASSSASSSQIASCSQIGSSTPSQLSNPNIVSLSEVHVSEITPYRFSKDTRSAIKL